MRTRHSAALLAVVLAAACTGPSPAPESDTATGSAPVTWLDAPTPTPGPVAQSPTQVRPCGASDLPATATYARTGGVSQSDSDVIELRNAGASACTPDADARLEYTDEGGQVRALPTDRTGPPTRTPATIAPGETATLPVIISHACDAAPLSYQGIVLIEAGTRIPVPGLRLTGTCPTVHLGAWQPPQRPDPIPAHLAYGGVQALVDAPVSVRAGAVLDYTVTLTNLGSASLSFEPCPVYQESLYKVSVSYRLNCPSGGLAAGGSVRFAMRIPVPDYAPAGRYLLDWTIVEAGGTSATGSAPIDVVPPA